MNIRKVSVIVLAIILSTFFTATILAEETEYEWKEVDGGVEITGYTGGGGEVVIPEQLGGKDVVGIGERVFQRKEVTRITIPESVIKIGYYAFSSNELKDVKIPNNLKEIGEGAFYNNLELETVHLGKEVKRIGVTAFGEIPDRVMVTIEEGNNHFTVDTEGKALYTGDGKKLLMGLKGFKGNVPDGVVTIGEKALLGRYLTEINLPDTLEYIEDSAFKGNEIREVKLPKNLKTIGNESFYWNDIRNITIPGTVESIGKSAFSYNLLSKLEIEEGVKEIKEYAFYFNNLRKVDLPNTLEVIKDGAFKFNLMVGTVIPENVRKIGYHAFEQWGNIGLRFVIMKSENPEIFGMGWDPFNLIGYTLYGKTNTEIEKYARDSNHIEFRDIDMLGGVDWIVEGYEGELNVSVPSVTELGRIGLSEEDQLIKRRIKGKVKVQDYRGTYDGWNLGVKASNFREVNSGEEIPEILIGLYGVEGWDVPEGLQEVELDYWEVNQWKEGIPLNFWDEINVIGVAEEGEGMGENILRFEEDGGFMVLIPGGVGKEGKYEAKISWKLLSVPSINEEDRRRQENHQ